MMIVTGGAGFIGSCLQAALFRRGEDTVVVDHLGQQGKWRNLAAHPPSEIVSPQALEGFLETLRAHGRKPRALLHLGAISATTACDGDLVWQTNVALSQRLWQWCAQMEVPFIYASSAATYGNGACGAANPAGHETAEEAGEGGPTAFQDGLAGVPGLRPLNLYGWSKQAFDLWVRTTLERGDPSPPQWAGLKFFNVYGPNEYHKQEMVSVVKVKYDEVRAGRPVTLFRSDGAGLADGHQRRDFIWVGDAVRVMLWLLDHPQVSGLFNCGTGAARTYLDLARLTCRAAGRPEDIAFVPMPEKLQGQYQSYTCADLTRLRAAGYTAPFTSLEDGISMYVEQFLMRGSQACLDDPSQGAARWAGGYL
ncbi:ADP-glyceromanno-heptose 6-epimerase [Oecophyllibacter saccharovorans]|uniref:ADP-glyceromanno-heptose 6-epimerase n=1 Tax=Oecophyllibacter saccharovorans TaxID=2558360 RepID=UPI0011434BA4|nr:ADP-glyceromanno-heptose 6-epimerase [Oecophyllibacter saccharovorans]QDH15201.1 ADP-glyceromanno-heptose 6-epimerase [Oecophyllibacter saccharovorans]